MTTDDAERIQRFLAAWAAARHEDALPPLLYGSAAAYRRSRDDWQPGTGGDAVFQFEDLAVTTGTDVALPSLWFGSRFASANARDAGRSSISMSPHPSPRPLAEPASHRMAP